jgi:hypothetical protein
VELAGLEDTVGIEVDGEIFPAAGKLPDGFVEGRTTAVHYLKATLLREATDRIRAGSARAAIVINHPKLSLRVALGAPLLKKLAEDLA